MTRDEAVTLARLERLGEVVAILLAHAVDLHGLGFEKAGRGLDPAAGGGLPSGVEAVGHPRARAIWVELVREVAAADKRLGDVKVKALNLLSEGPPTPPPSRGSRLRPDEFEAAIKRQSERPHPARLVPQPDYPGVPVKTKKKGRKK